jgi:hypothetical protein
MNNIEINPPSEMSASARAAEITTILAAAIVRTQLAQAVKQRDVGLGLLPVLVFRPAKGSLHVEQQHAFRVHLVVVHHILLGALPRTHP